LPWLAVGQLVLTNLDTIIGVVKPAFTRKKVEGLPSQADLLNQQILELQAAASSNADQIRQLAARQKMGQLSLVAMAISLISIVAVIALIIVR